MNKHVRDESRDLPYCPKALRDWPTCCQSEGGTIPDPFAYVGRHRVAQQLVVDRLDTD